MVTSGAHQSHRPKSKQAAQSTGVIRNDYCMLRGERTNRQRQHVEVPRRYGVHSEVVKGRHAPRRADGLGGQVVDAEAPEGGGAPAEHGARLGEHRRVVAAAHELHRPP